MGHQSFFQGAPCFVHTADRRQWSRKNGWSPPLHILQLLAWFFVVLFSLLYFGVIVPNLPQGPWQFAAYTINGTVFLVHIIIHIISISLNPADPNVRAKNFKGPLPTFDRNKHTHVIENQFCYICEVKVEHRSKHCSACNKCIANFDHHCKWLNNCVGGRNYGLFIACVSSALIGSLIILASSITLIVAFFSGDSWLYTTVESRGPSNLSQPWYFTSTAVDYPSTLLPETTSSPGTNSSQSGAIFFIFTAVDGTVWLSVVILTTSLAVLAIGLLGHLLVFHLFLIIQGLSTYEFIIRNRDSQSTPENGRQPPEQNGSKDSQLKSLFGCSFSRKANQISPMKQDGNAASNDDDLEMQAVGKLGGDKQWSPPTLDRENGCNNIDDNARLEQSVGNVYLGSPHRRQHLEPLYVRPKPRPIEAKQELLKVSINSGDSDHESAVNQAPASVSAPVANTKLSHAASRRLHQTPSPSPLSPILEHRIHDSQSLLPSSRYLSVSQLSLNKMSGDTTSDVDGEGEDTMLGDREKNGSLSNLFLNSGDTDKDEPGPEVEQHSEQEYEAQNSEVEMTEGDSEEDEMPAVVNDNLAKDADHSTNTVFCQPKMCDGDQLVGGKESHAVWAHPPSDFHNGLRGHNLVSCNGFLAPSEAPPQPNISPPVAPEMPVPRWNSDDQLRSGTDSDMLFHRRFSEDQTWLASSRHRRGSARNPYRHPAVQDLATTGRLDEYGKVFASRGYKKPRHAEIPCNIQSSYLTDSARLAGFNAIF